MSDTQKPETTRQPINKAVWLSILALIVAIVAITFSAFSWNQLNAAKALNDQNTNSALTANQALQSNIQQTQTNMQQLQASLTETQNHVAQMMRNNGQQQDTLSQIAYLINLADLQINVSQNSQSALRLITLAQQKVQALDDPRLFDLNHTLTKDKDILANVPKVNITRIITNIDTLNDAIANSALTPSQKDIKKADQKTADKVTQTDNNKKDKWYNRLWHHMSGIKNLVIIRRYNPNLKPLLNADQEILIKTSLQSKLLLAEYAAVQHNNELYQAHLNIVKKWISTYYFDSIDRRKLLLLINKLQAENVSPPVPNINATVTVLNQTLLNMKSTETSNSALQESAPARSKMHFKTSPKKSPTELNSNDGVAA